MSTISTKERREVARRLRAAKRPSLMVLMDVLGVGGEGVFARLADLIEPTCDRDALLALADEMKEKVLVYDRLGLRVPTRDVMGYARRIREALGVQDG